MLRWLALPVSVTFILQDQQSWDVHDTRGGPCSSITGCPVQQGTATVTMPAILCLNRHVHVTEAISCRGPPAYCLA